MPAHLALLALVRPQRALAAGRAPLSA